jgi:hypothetical protein
MFWAEHHGVDFNQHLARAGEYFAMNAKESEQQQRGV